MIITLMIMIMLRRKGTANEFPSWMRGEESAARCFPHRARDPPRGIGSETYGMSDTHEREATLGDPV